MHRIMKSITSISSIRWLRKHFCLLLFLLTAVIFTGCSKDRETSGFTEIEIEDAGDGTLETEEETDAAKAAEEEIPDEEELDKDADASGMVFVHVCGEVVHPGVYTLPAESRIYEAIEAAGGLTEQAAGESLNQAARIEDGQQIYVLSKEEAAQGMTADGTRVSGNAAGTGVGSQSGEEGKISLNTASKEQLMTLNGIGEAKAAAIIQYREEHGGFHTLEELMEVDGIKEGTYNKIKGQIVL